MKKWMVKVINLLRNRLARKVLNNDDKVGKIDCEGDVVLKKFDYILTADEFSSFFISRYSKYITKPDNLKFDTPVIEGELLLSKYTFLLNVFYFSKFRKFLSNPVSFRSFVYGPVYSENEKNGVNLIFDPVNKLISKNTISEKIDGYLSGKKVKEFIKKAEEKIRDNNLSSVFSLVDSYLSKLSVYEIYNLVHSDELWYKTFIESQISNNAIDSNKTFCGSQEECDYIVRKYSNYSLLIK